MSDKIFNCQACGKAPTHRTKLLCKDCYIRRKDVEEGVEYLTNEISGFTKLMNKESDAELHEFYRGIIVGYVNVINELKKLLEVSD